MPFVIIGQPRIFGTIAQPVARFTHIEEVEGSSPSGSTHPAGSEPAGLINHLIPVSAELVNAHICQFMLKIKLCPLLI